MSVARMFSLLVLLALMLGLAGPLAAQAAPPAPAPENAAPKERRLPISLSIVPLINGKADYRILGSTIVCYFETEEDIVSAEIADAKGTYVSDSDLLVDGGAITLSIYAKGWNFVRNFKEYAIPASGALDLSELRIDVAELIGPDRALLLGHVRHSSATPLHDFDTIFGVSLSGDALNDDKRRTKYPAMIDAEGGLMVIVHRGAENDDKVRLWSDQEVMQLQLGIINQQHDEIDYTPVRASFSKRNGSAFEFSSLGVMGAVVTSTLTVNLREPLAWEGTPEAKDRAHIVTDAAVLAAHEELDFKTYFSFMYDQRSIEVWGRYQGAGVFVSKALIPAGTYRASVFIPFFSEHAKFIFDRLEPMILSAGKAHAIPFEGLAPEISVISILRPESGKDAYEDDYLTFQCLTAKQAERREEYEKATDMAKFRVNNKYNLHQGKHLYLRNWDANHLLIVADDVYRPKSLELGPKAGIHTITLDEKWPTPAVDPAIPLVRVKVTCADGVARPATDLDFMIGVYNVHPIGPLGRSFKFDANGEADETLRGAQLGSLGRVRILAADGLNGYEDFDVAKSVFFKVVEGVNVVNLVYDATPKYAGGLEEVNLTATCLGHRVGIAGYVEKIPVDGTTDNGYGMEDWVVYYVGFEASKGPTITRTSENSFNFDYPAHAKVEISESFTKTYPIAELEAPEFTVPIKGAGIYGIYNRNKFENWIHLVVWENDVKRIVWRGKVPPPELADKVLVVQKEPRLVAFEGDEQGLQWLLAPQNALRRVVRNAATLSLPIGTYTLEAWRNRIRIYQGEPFEIDEGDKLTLPLPDPGFHAEVGSLTVPLSAEMLALVRAGRTGTLVYTNEAMPSDLDTLHSSTYRDPLGWMKSTHPAELSPDGKGLVIKSLPVNTPLVLQLRLLDGEKRFATAPTIFTIEAQDGAKSAEQSLAEPVFYSVRDYGTLPGVLAVRVTDTSKGLPDLYRGIQFSYSVDGVVLFPCSGLLIGVDQVAGTWRTDRKFGAPLFEFHCTPSAKSMAWDDADLSKIQGLVTQAYEYHYSNQPRGGGGPARNNGLGGGGGGSGR